MQNKVVRKNGKFASRKLSWRIKMFFNRSRSFGKRTKMAIALLFLIYIAGFSGWSLDYTHYAVAEVNVEIPQSDGRTIQERVWDMMDEAGFSLDQKIKAVSIVECESNWRPEARYINKNAKSVDRGLWMINDVYHKEVSNACAYDWECATREAIRIIKEQGFKPWVCAK